ncbi:hypothetical protein [Nocardia abscessus]|uniref:hypothetical protein n=1 Tax=Nocardia abscessus TaxID=120957 RepID=UPI0024546652|nr:hypothetical protein [Nocardia abscessus]
MGVSSLVTVLAGVGVLVDRTSDTPASIVPAAESSVVATTTERPAPGRCVMFCEDAALGQREVEKTSASLAPDGCRLFCELERGREGAGF